MAFSIDPKALIANALADAVRRSIIVGLPSASAPIPNFILCEIIDENARTSVQLSTLPTIAGDFGSKAVVRPGEFTMKIPLTDDDSDPPQWLAIVSTSLAALSNIGNQILSFGSVVPNLSALTTSYVGGQIAALTAMKNGRQPIMILQSYFNLGTLGLTNPGLTSEWFIEQMEFDALEGEQGCIATLTLKENLSQRPRGLMGALKNLVGELISPAAGAALGAIL